MPSSVSQTCFNITWPAVRCTIVYQNYLHCKIEPQAKPYVFRAKSCDWPVQLNLLRSTNISSEVELTNSFIRHIPYVPSGYRTSLRWKLRVWHHFGKPCSFHLNPLQTIFLLQTLLYTTSVRASQETHYVSATKPNRLMLFRETAAV
jgi:hypothetical protein